MGEDYGQYKYALNAVPVAYDKKSKESSTYFELAVTETYIKGFRIPPGEMGAKIRGVHFMYDFYPIMVEYTKESFPFLEFLTSVLAVIGGVMTLFTIIDSFVYESARVMKKK